MKEQINAEIEEIEKQLDEKFPAPDDAKTVNYNLVQQIKYYLREAKNLVNKISE